MYKWTCKSLACTDECATTKLQGPTRDIGYEFNSSQEMKGNARPECYTAISIVTRMFKTYLWCLG